MRFLLFLLLLPVCGMAQYNFYYGNIHSHTDYSDGNKDSATSGISIPFESFNYAKSSYHVDFWGISEHNHFSATNNPGMLLPRYADGLYQADIANEDGTFVCMYGMEFGTISQGGHVVTYGVPGLVGWEDVNGSPNYDLYCALNDFTTYWNIVKAFPKAFNTLAHPESGDYNDLLDGAPFSPAADSTLVGTAIRSGSAFSTTNDYSDAPATEYESKYKKCLARGYHVGPTIDHDNHYTTFGRTLPGRTVVLAKKLFRDSIIAAYQARRFYASDDWNTEVHYTLNGHQMGSVVTVNTDPVVDIVVNDIDPGDNVNLIELYYGVPGSGIYATPLVSVSNTHTLSYTHNTLAGDQYYYYAKITQSDGDIIWTSPIWITRLATPTNISEAITDQPSRSSFMHTLYPNPARDMLHLRYQTHENRRGDIKIYDALGRQVYKENVELNGGEHVLDHDISCYAPGSYYYVLQVENQRLIDTKFVKE